MMNTHVPATVEASFFRLLKLSAPSWLRIPGNISAISVKDQEKLHQKLTSTAWLSFHSNTEISNVKANY